ncbi:hypothetical protein BJ138DRAFT_998306 [Hygrophoropsis aurantiaca]|uniref:Uncharacterized protein n=1 Tax=Hygrophoropsis aurantiaca TaxID=72124 RepID=A0ACB8APT9_9AGAM|nr:hypothetical protein BJ138DRAFT_998306 [Hygrophoropsis aurantiaca]
MSNSLNSPFSPTARPSSRSSSRNSARSGRASSPSIQLNDSVAVRNHMSTLKHSIRHQQAQLHSLENAILRGPRPLPLGFMASPSSLSEEVLDISSAPTSYNAAFSTPKMQRRSSFDVLHSLAGRDSNLPLPRKDPNGTPSPGIREGIPMDFGVGSTHRDSYKRVSSPTRTLSRIPVASVGNARALADDGLSPSRTSPPSFPSIDASAANDATNLAASSSLQPPPSPNRRISLTPGGTTKVLADLQTGVVNARNALENAKSQLRVSQRTVAQLTRQTEDLKEGRERLRLENEGLNNVVARKERLLQEVLERARKAEAEASTLKSQLKTETATSKKSIRDMETALTESTTLSQKSEREYITLRDSLKSMTESWKSDTDKLRDEMRKREENLRKEAETIGKKYKKLTEEMKATQIQKETLKDLKSEDDRIRGEVEKAFREEIDHLKAQVEASLQQGENANQTAKELAGELARLRRLMQSAGRSPQPSFVEVVPP